MQSCQSLVLKWKAFLLIWKLLTAFKKSSLLLLIYELWVVLVHFGFSLFILICWFSWFSYFCLHGWLNPTLPASHLHHRPPGGCFLHPSPARLPACPPASNLHGRYFIFYFIILFFYKYVFTVHACIQFHLMCNYCVLYIVHACLHSIQVAKCVHLIIMNIFIHKKGIIFSIFIQY